MGKLKKLTSLLFAVSILISMMVTAPTALAAEDAKWVEKAPIAKENRDMSTVTLGKKIYVIGGSDSQGCVNSVAVYDTIANKWSYGANMLTARNELAAVTLKDKIYAIGGGNADFKSLVEIYDPSSDTWSQGTSMSTARTSFSAAVANGKIYAIGGSNSFVNGSRTLLSSVEVYDPVSNGWTTGKPMPTPLRNTASAVLDGKIYIMGGISTNNGLVNTTYVYDAEHSTWEKKSPVPKAIGAAKAVAIGNQIYLIGGVIPENGSTKISNLVYIYDVASDTWREGPSMIEARYSFGAEAVDNVIYAIGGYIPYKDTTGNYATASVEALTVASTTVERKLAVLLNVGETAQLSVSYDLTDNASLTWSTSNQAVATVDANGKVTAVGKGECDISAQNADGTWKQSIPVRVLPGTANMYRLAVHLKPTQNAKLHLTDNPADTTWKSLDPAVATIDATGKVTAVAQGLVIMEGTANGETKQIYVRVKG